MATGWTAGATLGVLDAAAVQVGLPSEVRGIPRRYRVGPASQPVDHSAYVEFEHTASGLGLRPYAPVHLAATSDGAGGHVVTWLRRSRIDGDNWALPDIPLGEAYEAYRVRVLSGSTVLREENVSAPVWTYDAATQVLDGAVALFDVEIAQISDLYGPGDTARIVINA